VHLGQDVIDQRAAQPLVLGPQVGQFGAQHLALAQQVQGVDPSGARHDRYYGGRGQLVLENRIESLAVPIAVQFAVSMPQRFRDGEFDPAVFRAFLSRAEALGFHSAWTQEQVLGVFPQLAPTETLTYAAACTEHLRLGCAVYVTPLHNPVQLAKSLSTLDQLSGGRLEIGLGAGGKHRPFGAFDADPASFVARFAEGLQLMQACWTDPEITFDGRFWQLDGEAMEPKPVQKPFPPLWFGGGHTNALRRAVRFGDGFFGAGSSTTAQFRRQVAEVRTILAEEGRDARAFAVAKRVYVHVDDDVGRARQIVTAELAQIYDHLGTDLTPVAVLGGAADCVARLREVVDVGVDMILLTPLHDETAQMERLAAEVIPQIAQDVP
jgi:probable F420-dependent oxidoreductase